MEPRTLLPWEGEGGEAGAGSIQRGAPETALPEPGLPSEELVVGTERKQVVGKEFPHAATVHLGVGLEGPSPSSGSRCPPWGRDARQGAPEPGRCCAPAPGGPVSVPPFVPKALAKTRSRESDVTCGLLEF